jgi:hypothetical protein
LRPRRSFESETIAGASRVEIDLWVRERGVTLNDVAQPQTEAAGA